MPTRILEHLKFTFDVFLITFLYIGGLFAISNEMLHTIIICGASVSGALVLAYFRRERNTKEIFFKSACAAISGLVCGVIVVRRWEITSIEYEIGAHFFSSLLSFFLIKGLLNVTEQNASGIVTTIIQRIFSVNGNQVNATKEIVKTDIIVKQDGEIKEIKTVE